MATVTIDKNNQSDVLQASEPVVVDFWASGAVRADDRSGARGSQRNSPAGQLPNQHRREPGTGCPVRRPLVRP